MRAIERRTAGSWFGNCYRPTAPTTRWSGTFIPTSLPTGPGRRSSRTTRSGIRRCARKSRCWSWIPASMRRRRRGSCGSAQTEATRKSCAAQSSLGESGCGINMPPSTSRPSTIQASTQLTTPDTRARHFALPPMSTARVYGNPRSTLTSPCRWITWRCVRAIASGTAFHIWTTRVRRQSTTRTLTAIRWEPLPIHRSPPVSTFRD